MLYLLIIVRETYLVDDTKACCGCELCPVGGSSKPFQIFSTRKSKMVVEILNIFGQA